MTSLSAVTSLSRVLHVTRDDVPVRLDPDTQLSRKLWDASASKATLSRTLWMMTGLNTLSSRWPLAPAKPTAASLP